MSRQLPLSSRADDRVRQHVGEQNGERQDLALATQGVTGVGVLGDDPQCDPIALAADEDLDRPDRWRIEALEAGPNDWHIAAQDAQALRRRREPVAVLAPCTSPSQGLGLSRVGRRSLLFSDLPQPY